MIPLFVYGTLRPGYPNNYILNDSQYSGQWTTVKPYYMCGLKSGAYPCVLIESSHVSMRHTPITGDLYYVTQDVLEIIDRLEGHPYQYIRRSVTIHNQAGHKVDAEMYVMSHLHLLDEISRVFDKRFVAINSGDWAAAKNLTTRPPT